MPIPLQYSNNANIKYPLSDFHETDVPNELLLNLSLNLPGTLVPVVSVVQVTAFTAFLAIEDESTHALIASVLVSDPEPARVYPMDMDVAGFGYVVFGPGLRDEYNSGNVSIKLDPDTVTYSDSFAPQFELTVNGIARDFSSVFGLEESTNALLFSIEGDTLYVDRNDAALTAEQIAGFTSLPGGTDDASEIVTTIAGVRPDSAGNVDIVFREQDFFEDCEDLHTLTPTRTLEGESPQDSLPLDELAPRYWDPDYECATPPEEPPDDPDTGAHVIQTAVILDVYDDKRVGVLYSRRGDELIEGSVLDGGYPSMTDDDDYESNIDGLFPSSVEGDYESNIESEF